MKHYVSNPHYTTEHWSQGASAFQFRAAAIAAQSINDLHQTGMENARRDEEVRRQQDQWKQNIPVVQAPESNRRTYGTAVDNRQYSAPPVGDYGMVSPQGNPQGVYGPNMYNASASNTEWGRRQF